MKWGTREMLHFDRVGSAWLIKRFIDPDASFVFLAPDERGGADVELFSVPGGRFAIHDTHATTFDRLLAHCGRRDAALDRMAKIVFDTVRHVMDDPSRGDLGARDPHLLGFLAVTEGIMLTSGSDAACLHASLPVFDALYARLQAQAVLDELTEARPISPYTETVKLVTATARLRARGQDLSPETFRVALQGDPA